MYWCFIPFGARLTQFVRQQFDVGDTLFGHVHGLFALWKVCAGYEQSVVLRSFDAEVALFAGGTPHKLCIFCHLREIRLLIVV